LKFNGDRIDSGIVDWVTLFPNIRVIPLIVVGNFTLRRLYTRLLVVLNKKNSEDTVLVTTIDTTIKTTLFVMCEYSYTYQIVI